MARWDPASVNLEVDVAANGSFAKGSRGRNLVVGINGKITGSKLEADIGGPDCAGHLSLSKSS